MPNLDALRQLMLRAGDKVNQYLGDVSAAAAPGAGNDLLSYVMNELTKYPGTTTAEKDAPKFDVANNVITNLMSMIGLNDPVSQIGGPSTAVLGPIGRASGEALGPGVAKALNQAQKKLAKGLFRADPELLAAVQSDPRMLMLHGQGADPRALATFRETMGGKGGEILASPNLMTGSQGNIYANVPEVMRHETTHFLRRPSMATAYSGVQSPSKIHDMIKMIEPYLGETAIGGIRQGINRTGNPAVGLDEALAYLSSPVTRSTTNPEAGAKLADILKIRAAEPGSTRGVGLSPTSLQAAVERADPQEKGLMDYIMSAFGGGR